MKIYANSFELRTPLERRYYAAPNSIFAFAVKATLDGEDADGTITVFQGSTELTPMEATIDGYKLYKRTSGSETAVNEFDIVYTKDTVVQHFTLIETITDSTVFDIDQEGGAFELPIASDSVLGGIKVGQNLTIEADGTLNAEAVAVYTAGNGIGINDNVISLTATIPTKVSELQNDKNYAELSTVPTKTSDLINDSNFATVSQIPTKTSDITNDSGFITAANVPTKTSELENDSGFITTADIPEVPVATTTTAGKVIVGSGLSVDANGKIDVLAGEETDPVFNKWLSGTNDIMIGKDTKHKTLNPNDNPSIILGLSASVGQVNSSSNTNAIGIAIGRNAIVKEKGIAIGDNAFADAYEQAIAIGRDSIADSGNYPTAIGCVAKATADHTIAVGVGSISQATGGIAIGRDTIASGERSIVIGYATENRTGRPGEFAIASAKNAIQLGTGINNEISSFQVYSYKVLDSDGNIPEARLSANALVKSTPTAVLSGTYSDGSEFSFDVYIKQ